MTYWRLIEKDAVHVRLFGDEAVAYNQLSGELHRLTRHAAELLCILEQGMLDLPTIAARCAEQLNLDADEAAQQHVAAILEAMRASSLVECVER